MTEKQAVKEIMRRAVDLKPTVHIGKDGLTEGIATELKEQIKRTKVVKVKVLDNSGGDVKATAEELAEATGTVLVDVRGSVAIFATRKEYNNLSQKKNL